MSPLAKQTSGIAILLSVGIRSFGVSFFRTTRSYHYARFACQFICVKLLLRDLNSCRGALVATAVFRSLSPRSYLPSATHHPSPSPPDISSAPVRDVPRVRGTLCWLNTPYLKTSSLRPLVKRMPVATEGMCQPLGS